jgi:hypothetical protein
MSVPKVKSRFFVTRCCMASCCGPGLLRVAAEQRIKRQIGDARQFLNLAADLAAETLGEERFSPKTGGRARAGRGGFRSLAKG